MAFVLAPRWISLNCLIPERFFVLNLLKPFRQLLPLVLSVGFESHLVKTSHYPERALLQRYACQFKPRRVVFGLIPANSFDMFELLPTDSDISSVNGCW